jgi:hypothetical protein
MCAYRYSCAPLHYRCCIYEIRNIYKNFEFRNSTFFHGNKCDRPKGPIGFRVYYCGAEVDRLGKRLINDRFQDICSTRLLHLYGTYCFKYAIMRCPDKYSVLVHAKSMTWTLCSGHKCTVITIVLFFLWPLLLCNTVLSRVFASFFQKNEAYDWMRFCPNIAKTSQKQVHV